MKKYKQSEQEEGYTLEEFDKGLREVLARYGIEIDFSDLVKEEESTTTFDVKFVSRPKPDPKR